jgi:hypothetical protein
MKPEINEARRQLPAWLRSRTATASLRFAQALRDSEDAKEPTPL